MIFSGIVGIYNLNNLLNAFYNLLLAIHFTILQNLSVFIAKF